MQHLTECILPAEPIEPEVTVAHRRGAGVRPACLPQSDPARWRELSAGRALELGAVPCTHPACADGVTS